MKPHTQTLYTVCLVQVFLDEKSKRTAETTPVVPLDDITTSAFTWQKLMKLDSYSETSLHSVVEKLQLQVMQGAGNDIQVSKSLVGVLYY